MDRKDEQDRRPRFAREFPVRKGDCEEATPAETAFADAMTRYLRRWRCINPTCGQVLDAAMTLGYRPPPGASKDFRELAEEFRAALHQFKKSNQRVRPSWPEVLGVLKNLGWTMANEAEVPVGFMPAAEVAGPSCLNAIGLFLEQGALTVRKFAKSRNGCTSIVPTPIMCVRSYAGDSARTRSTTSWVSEKRPSPT